MQSDELAPRETLSRLPRVALDDTLMTIMLLNEQPILAMADLRREPAREPGRARFCHIVRVADTWAEA